MINLHIGYIDFEFYAQSRIKLISQHHLLADGGGVPVGFIYGSSISGGGRPNRLLGR